MKVINVTAKKTVWLWNQCELSSPVVEQEEDVRDADDDLQPAPVRDEVGQQREDEDAPAEEHLEQNTDRPPVLHSNYLCD